MIYMSEDPFVNAVLVMTSDPFGHTLAQIIIILLNNWSEVISMRLLVIFYWILLLVFYGLWWRHFIRSLCRILLRGNFFQLNTIASYRVKYVRELTQQCYICLQEISSEDGECGVDEDGNRNFYKTRKKGRKKKQKRHVLLKTLVTHYELYIVKKYQQYNVYFMNQQW